MLTKSVHRTFECIRSDKPQKKFIPPWCSSRRAYGRKPKRHEYKEHYPLREHSEKTKSGCRIRVNEGRKGKLTILFLFIAVGFLALWMSNKLPRADLITNIGFAELNMNQSAQAACYDTNKHLLMEYSRIQKRLRTLLRLKKTEMQTYANKYDALPGRTYQYLEGATAEKGADTEEWQARLSLWGVVPLWRASPPINTILALRNPVPSDCWPFSGSYGEIIINLASTKMIRGVSIEHIRPDTARSAPKNFVLYGLMINGTEVKLIDNHYKSAAPAKQYYEVKFHAPFKSVILRILTNQGNKKFTCVYRFRVYG